MICLCVASNAAFVSSSATAKDIKSGSFDSLYYYDVYLARIAACFSTSATTTTTTLLLLLLRI